MCKLKNNNRHTFIEFDEDTKNNMKRIMSLCKDIFSEPLEYSQCQTILETLIDTQMSYSDDVSDLEDVFRAVIYYLEVLGLRLGKNIMDDTPF